MTGSIRAHSRSRAIGSTNRSCKPVGHGAKLHAVLFFQAGQFLQVLLGRLLGQVGDLLLPERRGVAPAAGQHLVDQQPAAGTARPAARNWP